MISLCARTHTFKLHAHAFDSAGFFGHAHYYGQHAIYGRNGEGATLNISVASLYVDCAAVHQGTGEGEGSGSESGAVDEGNETIVSMHGENETNLGQNETNLGQNKTTLGKNQTTNETCFDVPNFKDSEGEGCDFYAANDAYCERSGELGTLAFMNDENMDASRACCVCGGGTPDEPGDLTPTLYDTDGGYTCSGTLIHPRWVLTSARCASTAKHVELAISEGCPEKIEMVRVLVHPGHEYGGDYDVGLIELATPSSVTPVQIYEGGDLGYNDCHALQYIAAVIGEGKTLAMQLNATANEECDADLQAREGFQRVTR